MSEIEEQLSRAEIALRHLEAAAQAARAQLNDLRTARGLNRVGREMTNEQRALLEPHAGHFEMMSSYVRESSPEDLEELLAACETATPTNCAWPAYHAAQFLANEIKIRKYGGER